MFPNLFHSFTPNSQNSMQFSAFLWPSSSPIDVGSHHKRRPTQFPVGNKWNLVLAAIISSVLPDFVKIVNVIVQFSSTHTLTEGGNHFLQISKQKKNRSDTKCTVLFSQDEELLTNHEEWLDSGQLDPFSSVDTFFILCYQHTERKM